MIFPEIVHRAISQASDEVQKHPDHRLLPIFRLKIYQALRTVYGTPTPDLLLGHLGYLTAQKVRVYWDEAMPLWPDDEDEPEPKTRNLSSYFLNLLEQILQGKADLAAIWQELNNYWYVIGNIGDEIFEWRDTDTKLASAYYAIATIYKSLSETFPPTLLESRVSNLEGITEEMLQSNQLDAAGSAILAIVGDKRYEKNPQTSPQERLAFWQWWLQEALPRAKELARV
jgi:hypothetical protein